jgi:hypothetical protein
MRIMRSGGATAHAAATLARLATDDPDVDVSDLARLLEG